MAIVSSERQSSNHVTFAQREKELKLEKEREQELNKREHNSPFSRWTQYNNEHTKEMIWLALKHPKAHALLLFLVDQMDQYNAVVCSMQVLQEVLGVSRQTVSTSVKVLKDKGYIAVMKSGTSNIYAINDNVYWKSWSNNKKYSKFPANVVLSLQEQDEDYQQKQAKFFSQLAWEQHKEVIHKE